MNRRKFSTIALGAIASAFGVGSVKADLAKLNEINERIDILSGEVADNMESIGVEWPLVHIDYDTRPAEMFDYDIVDKDGVSVPNIVSAINEVEGWIEMYDIESPEDGGRYHPTLSFDHGYRIVGMSREDRVRHNEMFSSDNESFLGYKPIGTGHMDSKPTVSVQRLIRTGSKEAV